MNSKDLKFIKYCVGMMSTAGDQWLMLICLLAAFDKPVAWYIWVIFAIEKALSFYSAYKYKRETDV